MAIMFDGYWEFPAFFNGEKRMRAPNGNAVMRRK